LPSLSAASLTLPPPLLSLTPTLSLLAPFVALPPLLPSLTLATETVAVATLLETTALTLDVDCVDAVDDVDVDVDCCTCCNRRAKHSASNAALRSTCLRAASNTTLCATNKINFQIAFFFFCSS
jgi:hypothetical protein